MWDKLEWFMLLSGSNMLMIWYVWMRCKIDKYDDSDVGIVCEIWAGWKLWVWIWDMSQAEIGKPIYVNYELMIYMSIS